MRTRIFLAGLSTLFLAPVAWAAPALNDVRWNCAGSSCQIIFPFSGSSELPSYYQKFDPGKRILRVAFSLTEFSVPDGRYVVDDASPWVRSIQVTRDLARKPQLLYFDFTCGAAIANDKAPVSLRNKSEFTLEFSRGQFASAKGWRLTKLRPGNVAAVAAAPAPVAAKAPAPVVAAVKEDVPPLAPKGESRAFPGGVTEIAVLNGAGLEQFAITPTQTVRAADIQLTASEVIVPLQGPASSPLYAVAQGTIAKGVYWSAGKLVISLKKGTRPMVLVQGGRVILQKSVGDAAVLETWVALPSGVKSNSWKLPAKSEVVEGLDEFASSRQKSAALATGSSVIQLHKMEAAYVVVDDAVQLYEGPSEQSNVVLTMNFGERIQKLEDNGLFYKVKLGDRVGYVSRRQIAADNELSVTQKERLQRVMAENPDNSSLSVRFETMGDERVTYSSFGRRDPFIEVKGVADEGINIDQVELAGIIWEAEVPMALLTDTKVAGVSYTLREGDPILNGKVLKITKNDVLFLIQEFGVSRRYSMVLPDKYGGKK